MPDDPKTAPRRSGDPDEAVCCGMDIPLNLNERETTENQSATKHKEWEEDYAEGWEDCRQEHIKMRHVTDCARVRRA